jgi:anti-anti-sigma factor
MATNDLPYQFEEYGSYCVLAFLPTLNEEWSQVQEHAKQILSRVQNAPAKRLVLDLTELNYCGSAVVALMVRVWKNVQERKGTMAVACPSPVVRQVLITARLNDLWELLGSREAAERALGVGGRRAGGSAASRRGALWLAILGLAIAAAGGAWGAAQSFTALQIGLLVAGGIFLVVAAAVASGVGGAVAIAKIWTLVAYTGLVFAAGLALGKGTLFEKGPAWQKPVAALVALLIVGFFVMAWRSLGKGHRAMQPSAQGVGAAGPETPRQQSRPAVAPGASGPAGFERGT